AEATEHIHQSIANELSDCLKESDAFFTRDTLLLANFIVNSWQGALLRMKSSRSASPLNTFYQVIQNLLLDGSKV
ncbi:MAG: TetR family transcriptional regulator C-terminal domain-containing protein, partial [Candidatus Izemoplasmatales bacterium]|nr:TetR family transcriptional regulator C-terminal domain-containing protein [Candidatus Izemoplasmatales bacterium]